MSSESRMHVLELTLSCLVSFYYKCRIKAIWMLKLNSTYVLCIIGIIRSIIIFIPFLCIDLPVIFAEFFHLISPRVPEFRKPMYKQHEWLWSVSFFNIMYCDTLYVNQVNVIQNYWKSMLYHYTCLPVTLVTRNETNDCPF